LKGKSFKAICAFDKLGTNGFKWFALQQAQGERNNTLASQLSMASLYGCAAACSMLQ